MLTTGSHIFVYGSGVETTSLYYPDVVSQFCLLFSQAGDGSPETHVPFRGLDDQKGADDDEKQTGTEIKNTCQELDDQETDGTEGKAGLHIGVHGPFP